MNFILGLCKESGSFSLSVFNQIKDLMDSTTTTGKVKKTILASGIFISMGLQLGLPYIKPEYGRALPTLGALSVAAFALFTLFNIRDYENPTELSRYQKEAKSMSASQVISAHGSIRKALKNQVLSPSEMREKIQDSLKAPVAVLKQDLDLTLRASEEKSYMITKGTLRCLKGHIPDFERATKWYNEVNEFQQRG